MSLDMSPDTLRALYDHELDELYSAERQLLRVLPRFADASEDDDLRAAFSSLAQQKQSHLQRLDALFAAVSRQPNGHRCRDMERLIASSDDAFKVPQSLVRDAWLLGVAQRMERYAIASYHAAARIADKLGRQRACVTLRRTLREDWEATRTLESLSARRWVPGHGRAASARV